MQWDQEGQIRSMVADGTKPESDCFRTTIRYLAGSGRTDAAGQWTMDADQAACPQFGAVQWISMVATPKFNPRIDVLDPSFITVAWNFAGGNATLFARTWNCDCRPKPNTDFDYHVAIAYAFV